MELSLNFSKLLLVILGIFAIIELGETHLGWIRSRLHSKEDLERLDKELSEEK